MTDPTDITTRQATEGDIPLLAGWLEAFQEDARAYDTALEKGAALGTDATIRAMLAQAAVCGGRVLIAEIGGRPAGFASCAL